MSSRKPYILFLVNLTAFIILETISLTMVSHNSIVQHSEMMSRISAAVNTVTGATGNVLRYFSLGKVNRRLAEENVSLRTENDRLREALVRMEIPDTLYRDSSLFRYIPAAVVSNSTDRTHNVIIINRGRRDGVTEDMGVITDRGIIGYVESVGEKYSKVSSLLDTDNMASAVLRSSGTFGVLQWEGGSSREITLRDIPVHTEVRDGDTVISSGYSIIYPSGIPVGTVTAREVRDGVNYGLTVTMFEDFSRLRHVYVAVRKDINELNTLLDGAEGVKGGAQ